jgi:hypothetical protein
MSEFLGSEVCHVCVLALPVMLNSSFSFDLIIKQAYLFNEIYKTWVLSQKVLFPLSCFPMKREITVFDMYICINYNFIRLSLLMKFLE